MFRIEHNAETGEIKEIPLSPEEIAEFESMYEANRQKALEAENKIAEQKAQRQALLDKLGITEDEARLLLGGN